jgi:hypothetical protein
MFRSWKTLPARDRLRLVWIPLLIVVCGAVAAVAVDRGAGIFDSHGAHLQVIDVRVGNPWNETPRNKAHVEVKLHNTGDRRAILTSLRTEVVRSVFLPGCLAFGGEGTYETGRYSVMLPKQPQPGFHRENVLNEELGPDQVDRFRATFETQDTELFTVVLYELSLSVEASDGESVSLGRSLLMAPFPLSHWSWSSFVASADEQKSLEREGASGPVLTPELGEMSVRACYRRNEELITPFFESSAQRSAALERLFRHLEAVARS